MMAGLMMMLISSLTQEVGVGRDLELELALASTQVDVVACRLPQSQGHALGCDGLLASRCRQDQLVQGLQDCREPVRLGDVRLQEGSIASSKLKRTPDNNVRLTLNKHNQQEASSL